MKRNLIFMIVLIMAVGVTGCGKYHYHNSKKFLRTETEYKDTRKELKGFRLGNLAVDGRNLDFNVMAEYKVPEYKHDIYKRGSRRSKEPHLLQMINPLAYLIEIISFDLSFKNIFGSYGKWNYSVVKENTRQTGSKNEWRDYPSQKEVSVSINGSRWKKASVSRTGKTYSVNIGQMAEELPVKPEGLTVRLMTNIKTFSVQSRAIEFNPQQTAAMDLYSEEWELSYDQRMRKYMAAIKKKIRAGSYGEAVGYFEKIEGLGKKLPDSFDFQYGKTLIRAGYKGDGRERLKSYLGNAGSKGKYNKNAKALLTAFGNNG